MDRFAELFKIKQLRSSAYHPQSLGALERSHHTFVEYYRHYCGKKDWDLWLPYAIFSFNTSVHESTGVTPHELVFGRKVNLPSEFAEEKVPMTFEKLVDDILNRLVDSESMVHPRLESAKKRCKVYYDRKINEMNFKVGEYIYLLNEKRSNKFVDHYEGTFKITRIPSDYNVEIIKNDGTKVIVHMNRIKHAFLRYES